MAHLHEKLCLKTTYL